MKQESQQGFVDLPDDDLETVISMLCWFYVGEAQIQETRRHDATLRSLLLKIRADEDSEETINPICHIKLLMLADKYGCDGLKREAWFLFRNFCMYTKDFAMSDDMRHCEDFVNLVQFIYEVDSPENARELLVLSILQSQEAKDLLGLYEPLNALIRNTPALSEDLIHKRPKEYVVHCSRCEKDLPLASYGCSCGWKRFCGGKCEVLDLAYYYCKNLRCQRHGNLTVKENGKASDLLWDFPCGQFQADNSDDDDDEH